MGGKMHNQLINYIKLSIVISSLFSLISCDGADERKVKYLEKGKTYLEENNYDKAKVEFRNVLQIDPKFSEANYYIGVIEEERDEIPKAISFYKKSIELDPGYLEPKLKLAKIYAVIGVMKYANEARSLLKDIQTISKNNNDAKLISKIIEYKLGDKVKAKNELKNLLDNNIALDGGVDALSSMYINDGEDDKAIGLLKTSIIENPGDVVLVNRLVQLLVKNKRYDAAENQIKDLISVNSGEYEYQLSLAKLYTTTGNYVKAEQVLLKAIDKDNKNSRKILSYVDFILLTKSAEEATLELERFVKENQDLYDLKASLSDYYINLERSLKAKQLLLEIINDKSYDMEGTEARLKLATIYFNENNLEKADSILNEILKDNPNHSGSLYLSAKISIKNRAAASAINSLRSILKYDPKNNEVIMLLADAYLINGNIELAEAVLKDGLQSNPFDYKSHLNYAYFLYKNGKYDASLKLVDSALTEFHDNYHLLGHKLTIIMSKNDMKAAEDILNIMLETSPEEADVYIKRGQYYFSQKQYTVAIDEFKKALDRSINKYKVLQYIVEAYLADGKFLQAKSFLENRIANNKNDAYAMDLLGQLYLGSKDLANAKKYFNKSIDVSKSWLIPYANLAASYKFENQLDKAIEVYKLGIENTVNNVVLMLQLAGLHEKLSEYNNAILMYREILKTDRFNIYASNNLAALLVDIGDGMSDIDYAVKLVKNIDNINQSSFQDTVGWVYAKAGDYDRSIELLQQVVNNAPKISVYKYHLGYALFKSGDVVNGKKYLQEAYSSEQQFLGKDNIPGIL